MERRMDRWMTHAVNHRTCVGFGVVLIAVHLIIVAQRVYQYRHYSAWIVTARASGQCLHLDVALVILLTLRRSITWLRARRLDWLLPLDRHVYFHKILGWTICVQSVVHTLAHVINYGIVSQAKGVPFNDYLFDPSAGWIPGWVTPTGLALLVILAVMGLCSHRVVRKSGRFELFYWTHLLCLPFFLLLILHGGNVWKWLVGPLILLGIEVFHRAAFVCSDQGRARVTSLQLLPNQVVRLVIERPVDFEFQAGDYVYVNLPQVAQFEWHPFTISSAPEEAEHLTLHIRVAGGWTGRLYTICQEDVERLERQQDRFRISAAVDDKMSPFHAAAATLPDGGDGQDNLAYQPDATAPVPEEPISVNNRISDLLRLEMPIQLDGPYSGSSTRAWSCRHALFIAGGIGVTPFASLLQSLVARYQSAMTACPHCLKSCCTNVPSSLGKLRHVDFMWINRDLLSFQWFLELLLDLDREQSVRGSVMAKFLDIQLYQTGVAKPDAHRSCVNCVASISSDNSATQVVINSNSSTEMTPGGVLPPDPPPLPVMTAGRCPYCTIRQVQHLLRYGRPVWDEVFREVALRCGGQVTVFYCGPAAMGRVVMLQCRKFGFTFTKEIS